MPLAATWMQLAIILRGARQKDKYHLIQLIVQSKKRVQMNLLGKHRVTDVENKLFVTKGERGGGINSETGIDIYTLLSIKQITNKIIWKKNL